MAIDESGVALAELLSRGHELSQRGAYADSERLFRLVINRASQNAMAWNNLGWVLDKLGDSQEAIRCYQEALQIDENHTLARRNLVRLFVHHNLSGQARQLIQRELCSGDKGYRWLERFGTDALVNNDFQSACDLARIMAELRWGSQWYPRVLLPGEDVPKVPRDPRYLTIAKLFHDIAQMEYLDARNLLPFDLERYRHAYKIIAERLWVEGIQGQVPLNAIDEKTIGDVYNRLIYVRDTPRVHRALSSNWSGMDVTRRYSETGIGVVVVDNFLSIDALEELRSFCLESTVWNANRYGHGRLGAFFQEGFCCPLLLQIAEELRLAMPELIRQDYPLRQVWGFKNTGKLPIGSTLHADFAAVNVNIWITPESANQDESSGGMDVYNVSAPLWWDFLSYNARADLIRVLLKDRAARSISIPYRANRAVLFNSDLFHATQAVDFASGYVNHRINITFLFGDRESDLHFSQPASPTATTLSVAGARPAWRSLAFRRSRSSSTL
jgi:tetratricopeptide (TPR) repeat protein